MFTSCLDQTATFFLGHIYHVTHRCHDKSFLLKFARDRNDYRERLRKALEHYDVSVLGYPPPDKPR